MHRESQEGRGNLTTGSQRLLPSETVEGRQAHGLATGREAPGWQRRGVGHGPHASRAVSVAW